MTGPLFRRIPQVAAARHAQAVMRRQVVAAWVVVGLLVALAVGLAVWAVGI